MCAGHVAVSAPASRPSLSIAYPGMGASQSQQQPAKPILEIPLADDVDDDIDERADPATLTPLERARLEQRKLSREILTLREEQAQAATQISAARQSGNQDATARLERQLHHMKKEEQRLEAAKVQVHKLAVYEMQQQQPVQQPAGAGSDGVSPRTPAAPRAQPDARGPQWLVGVTEGLQALLTCAALRGKGKSRR
uniref:Uncharacterized protein n=1 Tax=Prymnesium polylepis TaxID=72548 RepID=A0A7S4HFS6_9EUKA